MAFVFSQAALAWESGSYARYEQYKRPVFIARLQTASADADAEALLSGSEAFRMDLAIEADYLSDRRVTRLWRESMSINISPEDQAAESKNIAKLYEFIAYDLYRGDHFQLEYDPARGTSLQVNKQPAVVMSKSNLGVLMLRGLLGNVPLSSEFKQAMLGTGQRDSSLIASFELLQPEAARSEQIASAKEAKAEEAVAVAAVETPKETPKKVESTQTKKEPAPKAVETKTEAKVATAATNPVKVDTKPQPIPQAKPEQKPETTTVAEKPKVAQAEADAKVTPKPDAQAISDQQSSKESNLDETVSKSKEPAVQVAMLDKAVENKADATKSDAAASVLSVSRGLKDPKALAAARQAYQEELERAIRKYQTIPYKAFSRRMEGDVLLDIAVDASGNITKLNLAKPSRHNVLNDQALDAVASAEPFEPIPSDLGVSEFNFQVKLSYDLIY